MLHGLLNKVTIKDRALVDCVLIDEETIVYLLEQNGIRGIVRAEFANFCVDRNYFQPHWTDKEIKKLFEPFCAWKIVFANSDEVGFYQVLSGTFWVGKTFLLMAIPLPKVVKIKLLDTVYAAGLRKFRVSVRREYAICDNILTPVHDLLYLYEKHDADLVWKWPMTQELEPMSIRMYQRINPEKIYAVCREMASIAEVKVNVYDVLTIKGYEPVDIENIEIDIGPEYIPFLDGENVALFFDFGLKKIWRIRLKKNGIDSFGFYFDKLGVIYVFPCAVFEA